MKASRKEIHTIGGEPIMNLYAAVILQAFEDYAACCRIMGGGKHGNKGITQELAANPVVELWLIRQWLRENSQECDLVKVLGHYLDKRQIKDAFPGARA